MDTYKKIEELEEQKKLIEGELSKLKPKEYPIDGFFMSNNRKYAINSGEYREPQFGEYYLSGASIVAYQCLSKKGYSDKFYIATIKNR